MEYNDIFEVYQIISAIPCTQADVERLFSGVKLVLSEQRNRLKEDTLANIMLLRCNSKMVKTAPFIKILK